MSALTEGYRLGPYRIVRLLGEGGMGSVYEARQEPLERRVALKTLHPEYARNNDAVARFFNEAKVLSRLEHPSIVQVSDFGNAADGTAYLVMEYLRGQSLGQRLADRDGRLPVITALQLAWQVADVLAVAHAQGIIHRDLKPENLMLVADPIAPGGERVKILDFGIAKLTKSSDRGSVKTDTQAVMGTPMYMSPEQCAGAGNVDTKSDVYSLGCVLYKMLSGRPPFIAEGPGQFIGMHLFQPPPPLTSHAPKVSVSVAELVHRLLLKDKAQRPTMSETADALGRLLGKFSGTAQIVRSRPPASTDPDATRPLLFTPPSTTLGQLTGQRSRSSTKRNRVVAVGVAVALVASALAAIFHSRRSYTFHHALSAGSKVPIVTAPAGSPSPNTPNITKSFPSPPLSLPDSTAGTIPSTVSIPSVSVPPGHTNPPAPNPGSRVRPPSGQVTATRPRPSAAHSPAATPTLRPIPANSRTTTVAPHVSPSANPVKLDPYDL